MAAGCKFIKYDLFFHIEITVATLLSLLLPV